MYVFCVFRQLAFSKKKSEAELAASILKKDPITQEIERTFFNWTKLDKMCKVTRKSSFSSYAQHKNRKTNNSTYLVSVRCWEAGGRKRA